MSNVVEHPNIVDRKKLEAEIVRLKLETLQLRIAALKAFTVVNWMAGDGLSSDDPDVFDTGDALVALSDALGIEWNRQAHDALRRIAGRIE